MTNIIDLFQVRPGCEKWTLEIVRLQQQSYQTCAPVPTYVTVKKLAVATASILARDYIHFLEEYGNIHF